jgi:hypothetical protein
VHKEELNIADVVDEESLVAGWHHMASLLVGTETNLCNIVRSCSLGIVAILSIVPISNSGSQRTDGITICPLKRLRTRLSIPFGFLQLGSTRMKVSL